MTIPSNFCRLPWTGFSIEANGETRPCCIFKNTIPGENGKPMFVQTSTVEEIFNSKFMQNLRDDFRANKQPPGCEICWTDEKNKVTSKRERQSDPNTLKKSGKELWEEYPVFPIEYQMILSNVCNLKCRSCGPSHSSKWQAELMDRYGKSGFDMPHKQAGDAEGKLWTARQDWYKTINRLEIVGGEPFYTKQWTQVFNELIDAGFARNILLAMSTNCTIFNEELLNKCVQNFRMLGLGLSVDGIGPVYEYMRHPGNWDDVYKNMCRFHSLLNKFPQRHVEINVNYTISWLNAFDLTTMHSLVRTNFPKFKIWHNIVHGPEHLALWAIPTKLKDAIVIEWEKSNWKDVELTPDDLRGIMAFMYSKDISEDQFVKNLHQIKKIDKYRNENLIKAIPVLTPYVQPYWDLLHV